MNTDNAFDKAWVRNCYVHPEVRGLFFRKCWKCRIRELTPKTITEIKYLIHLKNLNALS